MTCRCQRDTPTHLCHFGAYTCPSEGTERFVVTNPTPMLAGMQRKVTGYFTFACDEHWAAFQKDEKPATPSE